MDYVYIVVGLLLLVFAGDALVRGAVALSLKLGVSALVVSLTIVAFGTSAPELLVGVKATLNGSSDLVYGNVVGSNIANVFLVLGVPALITPIVMSPPGSRQNFLTMLAVTVLFIAVCGMGGMTAWVGVAFLVLLIAILYSTYQGSRNKPDADLPDEVAEAPVDAPMWKVLAILGAGLIFLPIGAGLLIEGAQNVAVAWGVPEAIIGLTLVAIGTSLPELATTVMAAVRRQADVALGGVIGSNTFNILAVMGASSFFGSLPTPAGFMEMDLWIMLGATLAMAPFIFLKRDMGRLAGVIFLGVYLAYLVFAVTPLGVHA
ncbi:MAG: calcium/sodium antiporter [Pikeienuella sp.]